MSKSCYVFPLAIFLASLWSNRLSADPGVSETLRSATEVLDALQAIPLKSIPPALLRGAQGVAIIPHVIKLGFVAGGRYGEGVVVARNPDGTWSSPVFITLTGGSIGLQAGIQSADIVLVFKTHKTLERLLQGKDKLTLGADVAVAAGPIGRQAEADTDAKLQAEIYSYSRSRGLFAGLALEGAVIRVNAQATEAFARRARPEDLHAAERLMTHLLSMMGMPPVLRPHP